MSAILLDGSIVHYEVLGRGRPVIFLHGWVGSWRYWIASMQVASTSYRAYALDLWGFGDSAHNDTKYSLDNQASLLDRFLIEMGIGKIALVGHGLGGLVGMAFANRFPQNVDRIMAVSCPLHIDGVSSRLRTPSTSPSELTDWLSSRTPEATTALSDSAKTDGRAIAASLDGLQGNNPYNQFRNVEKRNLNSSPDPSAIPCLLVYGEKDQAIFAPEESFPLSSMTHQVLLEGSGHFPMIDETIKFNRLLTDFLALEPGTSPSELQMKEEWRRRVR
ncbi:MAG: alpha/beta hydrolase [Anaerolineae bacterium]|nr:alpha/beta hydrolase [Anaerolineae bacterium]